MTGIYVIISPTFKVYVGQSRNLKLRQRYYGNLKCAGQIKLFNSLKKYGWLAHTFKIVHDLPADVSRSILDTYEQLYMDLYRASGIHLLNLKEGGLKGTHGPETRGKLSKANTGKKVSAETREKMRLANLGRRGKGMYGKKHTPESLAKMSVALIGKPSGMKGKTTSAAVRLKQSIAAKNRNPKTRKKCK